MSAPTTDLYASALAAIEARRKLVKAGTPGPWRRHPDRWAPPQWEPDMAYLRVEAGEPHPSSGLGTRIFHTDGAPLKTDEDKRHEADVALAVAAVNAFAADTDALAAVLKRHAPCELDERFCLPANHRGSVPLPAWPCPDAQSVLRALGVTS